MLIRPTPQYVGLDDKQLEDLKTLESDRDILRSRVAAYSTGLIGIGFALYVLIPFKTDGLLIRLSAVVILSLVGWPFVMTPLLALTNLFLRKPIGYEKVEAYSLVVLDFERNWREQYWKCFWDSIARLAYHMERGNEYPKVRLGFLEHWRILEASLFFIFNGKRHIFYIVPEGHSQFELETAHNAVNTRCFYYADLMCIVSPNGFSKEAIEYLAKNHSGEFLCQMGAEAAKFIDWLKTCDNKAPAIPLDIVEATSHLSQALRKWQKREDGL